MAPSTEKGYVYGCSIHSPVCFDLAKPERESTISVIISIFSLSYIRTWIWPIDIPVISMSASQLLHSPRYSSSSPSSVCPLECGSWTQVVTPSSTEWLVNVERKTSRHSCLIWFYVEMYSQLMCWFNQEKKVCVLPFNLSAVSLIGFWWNKNCHLSVVQDSWMCLKDAAQ